jgi:hypothetical protein
VEFWLSKFGFYKKTWSTSPRNLVENGEFEKLFSRHHVSTFTAMRKFGPE